MNIEIKCRAGLKLEINHSSAVGYWIGTTDWSEGFPQPKCRCSGYYKTRELAEQALKNGTWFRSSMENMPCHQGLGCRIDPNISEDGEWDREELRDILYTVCRKCIENGIEFLLRDPKLMLPTTLERVLSEKYDLVDLYNKAGNLDKFDTNLEVLVLEFLDSQKSDLYISNKDIDK